MGTEIHMGGIPEYPLIILINYTKIES